MKYLLLLLLPFTAGAQELPTKDGKVYYEFIDSLDMSQSEIYGKAVIWAADKFSNSNVSTRMADEKNGEYISKGFFSYTVNALGSAPISYTLRISARDGKYRLSLYDFYFVNTYFGTSTPIEEYKRVIKKKRMAAFVDEVTSEVLTIKESVYKHLTATAADTF